MRGRFTPGVPADEPEWCHRRLLARIHRLTIGRLRREIEPVTTADFVRFLHRWQHLAPGAQLHGADGVLHVIKQLQGYEISAAAWESDILPRRVAHYSPEFLDQLCLSGEVMWGRLSPHPAFDSDHDGHAHRVRPTRVAPLTLFLREDADWLLSGPQPAPDASLSHPAREVLAELQQRGASFFPELARATGRLASEVEDALWELVAAGLVTADGFENLRALVDPKRRRGEGRGRLRAPRHAAGRWALLRRAAEPQGEISPASFARQLLQRWGVVFRDLAARETLAPPWRDLLVELRRMEARGEIRGGRFAAAFLGEQFALPEALDLLRAVRRASESGEIPEAAPTDPLHFVAHALCVPGEAIACPAGADLGAPRIEIYIYIPPLTFSTCPVIYPASSLARKRTAAAISSGRPSRRSGTWASSFSFSSSVSTAVISVSMNRDFPRVIDLTSGTEIMLSSPRNRGPRALFFPVSPCCQISRASAGMTIVRLRNYLFRFQIALVSNSRTRRSETSGAARARRQFRALGEFDAGGGRDDQLGDLHAAGDDERRVAEIYQDGLTSPR